MSLTAAQIQAQTDKLGAYLLAQVTGAQNTLVGATNLALRDLLAAAGIDPSAVDTLGASARAVDQMFLPGNIPTSIRPLFGGPVQSLVQKYQNYAQDPTGGGGAAGFGAYLTSTGAKVHPLVAEAFRYALGEGGIPAASVFPPVHQAVAPTKCYVGTPVAQANTALVDLTTAAGNATTADLAVLQASGDEVLIGSTSPFTALVIALSTKANVTTAFTVKYWNGTAYTPVTGLSDLSVGLTKNQPVTFTKPADWEPCAVDSLGGALGEKTPLYYLSIKSTATAGTPPVGTCVSLIPSTVLLSTGKLYGLPQPPLLLCRITAANTLANLAGTPIDLTRFAALLGSDNTVRLRALTPIAADLTVTLGYVKGDGTTAATNAQSAWTAPAALATKTVALGGGNADTLSAASAGTAAVVTAATDGCFAVESTLLRTPAL